MRPVSPAFWVHLVVSHIWGAAIWVRPGWLPVAVACVFLLLAGVFLFAERRGGNP